MVPGVKTLLSARWPTSSPAPAETVNGPRMPWADAASGTNRARAIHTVILRMVPPDAPRSIDRNGPHAPKRDDQGGAGHDQDGAHQPQRLPGAEMRLLDIRHVADR